MGVCLVRYHLPTPHTMPDADHSTNVCWVIKRPRMTRSRLSNKGLKDTAELEQDGWPFSAIRVAGMIWGALQKTCNPHFAHASPSPGEPRGTSRSPDVGHRAPRC